MPTDLAALAVRKRYAVMLAENNNSLMVLSLIAYQIVVALLFVFPAFASATALLGNY
jgi:hypothetical protein